MSYTKTQIDTIITNYDPEAHEAERTAQIQHIADTIHKTYAEVRAKLTNLKLYIPVNRNNKANFEGMTKGVMLEQIHGIIPMRENEAESMRKVVNSYLYKLIQELK